NISLDSDPKGTCSLRKILRGQCDCSFYKPQEKAILNSTVSGWLHYPGNGEPGRLPLSNKPPPVLIEELDCAYYSAAGSCDISRVNSRHSYCPSRFLHEASANSPCVKPARSSERRTSARSLSLIGSRGRRSVA